MRWMKWYAVLLALGLGLGVLWSPPVSGQQGFKVIVHDSNPVTSIDKDELSRIFLKRISKWDDGNAVKPVDLGKSSSVREAFSEAVHGRSVGAIKSYWQRQIFSGRGAPPDEVESENEVIRFVASTPGAVGYVSIGLPVPGGVKAVQVR